MRRPRPVGDTFTLSLTDPADVSAVDQAAGFTYAFDCGNGDGFVGALDADSTGACTAEIDGSVTVRGKVADKDGGQTVYSAESTSSATRTATA